MTIYEDSIPVDFRLQWTTFNFTYLCVFHYMMDTFVTAEAQRNLNAVFTNLNRFFCYDKSEKLVWHISGS